MSAPAPAFILEQIHGALKAAEESALERYLAHGDMADWAMYYEATIAIAGFRTYLLPKTERATA